LDQESGGGSKGETPPLSWSLVVEKGEKKVGTETNSLVSKEGREFLVGLVAKRAQRPPYTLGKEGKKRLGG